MHREGVTLSLKLLALVPQYCADDSLDVNNPQNVLPTWQPDVSLHIKTVGEYFRLDKASNFYTSRVEALICQALRSSLIHGPVFRKGDDGEGFDSSEVCGRCASGTHQKHHQNCSQFIRNGKLLHDGVCGNCVVAASESQCSMKREFLKSPQLISSLSFPFRLELILSGSEVERRGTLSDDPIIPDGILPGFELESMRTSLRPSSFAARDYSLAPLPAPSADPDAFANLDKGLSRVLTEEDYGSSFEDVSNSNGYR